MRNPLLSLQSMPSNAFEAGWTGIEKKIKGQESLDPFEIQFLRKRLNVTDSGKWVMAIARENPDFGLCADLKKAGFLEEIASFEQSCVFQSVPKMWVK